MLAPERTAGRDASGSAGGHDFAPEDARRESFYLYSPLAPEVFAAMKEREKTLPASFQIEG